MSDECRPLDVAAGLFRKRRLGFFESFKLGEIKSSFCLLICDLKHDNRVPDDSADGDVLKALEEAD